MDSAANILRGFQLSLVPQVEKYHLENPSSPEQAFSMGDRVRLRDGTFLHGGKAYDSGVISTSNIPQIGYGINLGNGAGQTWHKGEWLELVAAATPEPAPPPGRKRRHSKKGEASGWIEERYGNKARKRQSLSLY
jgi:hypothetical protein